MQRSVFNWNAIALLGLALTACTDEGVGDPCIPETIPCKTVDDANAPGGKKQVCGFQATESYIESSSVQCRSRLCIVHKLDNLTSGKVPANPTNVCSSTNTANGCVQEGQLDDAVYCTCRCDGPKTSVEFCECPDGFSCEEILSLGGDGIRGSYCVRPH
jgi:hypothetical protein